MRVRKKSLLTAVAIGAAGLAIVGIANAADPTPTTTRLSVAPDGSQATGSSDHGVLAANGKVAAFSSSASNLTTGDTNQVNDVFTRDLTTGAVELVSAGIGGVPGTAASTNPSVSRNGRYVAFESDAGNLVPGDTNKHTDVFVRDTKKNVTTRVSVATAGTEADGDSWSAAISAEGRFVTFTSTATNLVAGVTAKGDQVYRYDIESKTTILVSATATGAVSNAPTGTDGHSPHDRTAVSTDGRYVAFASAATDLVAGDTNGKRDIFVRDTQAGTTVRASVNKAGQQGNGDSRNPTMSLDGHLVAFDSDATNLVTGDTNAQADAFVRDLTNSLTYRTSLTDPGAQATGGSSTDVRISTSGRFVVFGSTATNLVTDAASEPRQVYVRDRLKNRTFRVSVNSAGAAGDHASTGGSISTDGKQVVFDSQATNLVNGDTGDFGDVFQHLLG